jgi:acyl-CoA reductase-like NAD-dependent aldehyde dehydrogenase
VSYEPTVLLNPPKDAKVSTQEVFGPVVCIYGYKTLDEAIEQANSLDVSFLSTVQKADKIIVLRQGEVIEQGSHQELLSANGEYASLYKHQFS